MLMSGTLTGPREVMVFPADRGSRTVIGFVDDDTVVAEDFDQTASGKEYLS